jgi:hypothetical protein
MQFQPAALDRAIKPSFVFRRRRLVLVQHRAIEPLDQNAAVHIGLVIIGKLDDLARGGFGVGIGSTNLFTSEFLAPGRRRCEGHAPNYARVHGCQT